MEVEAARGIWERSVEKHKFHYTTVLSNSYRKSFIALAEAVYGDTAIYKEECANHASKRKGITLRNLVDDCKSRKKSTLGKGKLNAVNNSK